MAAPTDQLTGVFVAFARGLRTRGLNVGTGQIARYCAAVDALQVTSLTDIYWAGRSALVSRRSEGRVYDEEFLRFFFGWDTALAAPSDEEFPPSPSSAEPDDTRATGSSIDHGVDVIDEDSQDDETQSSSSRATREELLRVRSFTDWTADEVAVLARLMAQLRIRVPLRLAGRLQRSPKGDRLDLRRTVRHSLRHEGEVIRRAWKRRIRRPRPLVMLIDVSGSMAAHSRALLHLAYVACHSGVRVEVFCFGTRLTRVTPLLADRDPDTAVAMAAAAVADWDGGTRIGDSLREFLKLWSRQGTLRGSLVLIFSDGLERGDPDVLEAAMARLARLTYRIVWLNPLKADPEYEPLARGMKAALPHIDRFVPADSMADLDAVVKLIPVLV